MNRQDVITRRDDVQPAPPMGGIVGGLRHHAQVEVGAVNGKVRSGFGLREDPPDPRRQAQLPGELVCRRLRHRPLDVDPQELRLGHATPDRVIQLELLVGPIRVEQAHVDLVVLGC
jgi:hypothetical protein